MEAVLEDAYILIHEKKVSSLKDLLRFEQIAKRANRPDHRGRRRGRSAGDACGEQIRGTFQACAVKRPDSATAQAMLQDIAVLTGGLAITEDLGRNLEHPGRPAAPSVVVDKDNTTIVEGAGSSSEIAGGST